VRDRLNLWLEDRHPNLSVLGYKVKSRRNKKYNCIAFALGKCDVWWDPTEEGAGFYWPKKKVPMEDIFDNYIKLFEFKGFRQCADASFIPGFEKVALYRDIENAFTHVAKQDSRGLWLSKLGPFEDIEHKNPEALRDDSYGIPATYLQRKVTLWTKTQRLLIFIWCRAERSRKS